MINIRMDSCLLIKQLYYNQGEYKGKLFEFMQKNFEKMSINYSPNFNIKKEVDQR